MPEVLNDPKKKKKPLLSFTFQYSIGNRSNTIRVSSIMAEQSKPAAATGQPAESKNAPRPQNPVFRMMGMLSRFVVDRFEYEILILFDGND